MKYFIVSLSIVMVLSCKDIVEIADKEMPATIEMVINQHQADSFMIDSIANFEWDQLFVLKPYLTESQYAAIERHVDNMPWMGPATFSADWEVYLVFVRNGKAIKFSQVPRYPFDFQYVGNIQNPAVIRKGTFLHYKKETDGRFTIY